MNDTRDPVQSDTPSASPPLTSEWLRAMWERRLTEAQASIDAVVVSYKPASEVVSLRDKIGQLLARVRS